MGRRLEVPPNGWRECGRAAGHALSRGRRGGRPSVADTRPPKPSSRAAVRERLEARRHPAAGAPEQLRPPPGGPAVRTVEEPFESRFSVATGWARAPQGQPPAWTVRGSGGCPKGAARLPFPLATTTAPAGTQARAEARPWTVMPTTTPVSRVHRVPSIREFHHRLLDLWPRANASF